MTKTKKSLWFKKLYDEFSLVRKQAKKYTEKEINKTIILTGSMIPIVGFSISDAAFNLGYSIASFGYIKYGVYICMNGGLFGYDEVDKNTELLRFE